jgi:hypothetical protein
VIDLAFIILAAIIVALAVVLIVGFGIFVLFVLFGWTKSDDD